MTLLNEKTLKSNTLGTGAYTAALAGYFPTITASGALNVNRQNEIDCTAGNLTMTLPTGQPAGSWIQVEKIDVPGNSVTITGSIRGIGSSSVGLSLQNESIFFVADSAGSWAPFAGHKTLGSMDARYQAAGTNAAVGAQIGLATMPTSVSGTIGNTYTDISGTPLALSVTLGSRQVCVRSVLTLQATGATILSADIYDSTASALLQVASAASASAGGFVNITTEAYVTPGAGTRGYRVQIKSTSSTVVVIYGGNNQLSSHLEIVQR